MKIPHSLPVAMRMHALWALSIAVSMHATPLHATTLAAPPAANDILGRWDMTVKGPSGDGPAWLEVTLSGRATLVGRFMAFVGSARPVSKVEYADGTWRFAIPPQWESSTDDARVEMRMDNDKLVGWLTTPEGARLPFVGVRAPALRHAEPKWGAPVALFDGKSLSGWQSAGTTNQWQVIRGILTSATPGSNLRTARVFADFKLHVEFRLPPKGNSGVYLRGRAETQVEDSKGMELDSHHMGGIYGFLTPNEDAAKGPGEWQSMDITLVGRLVTVVLNGRAIIVRQEIPGITGGALDSNEGEPGPILLQGDHTSIEYRKVVLTPPR